MREQAREYEREVKQDNQIPLLPPMSKSRREFYFL